MSTGEHMLTERRIRIAFLHSLLRSRRAITRMLESVSAVAENDPSVARHLAEHVESLAALQQSVDISAVSFGGNSVRAPAKRRRLGPPLLMPRQACAGGRNRYAGRRK